MIIAWSSEEYIGERGVQIELTHGEGEGYTKNGSSHPTTVATLVKLKEDHIVESTLSIVVSSHYEAATITCVNVGHNKSSISFKLLGIIVYVHITVLRILPTLVDPSITQLILPPLKANLPPLAVYGTLILMPQVIYENNCCILSQKNHHVSVISLYYYTVLVTVLCKSVV